MWPIGTRWVGSTAVASNSGDRVQNNTSIPIVWGSKTWEGYGSFLLSVWQVKEEKLILKCQSFKGSVWAFPSLLFGREIWSSSTEQGQDAVKVKTGRKVAKDKSQGRHHSPRRGEEHSLCGLRCCSVLDSFSTMPNTRKQPWRIQTTPKHNWGGDWVSPTASLWRMQRCSGTQLSPYSQVKWSWASVSLQGCFPGSC